MTAKWEVLQMGMNIHFIVAFWCTQRRKRHLASQRLITNSTNWNPDMVPCQQIGYGSADLRGRDAREGIATRGINSGSPVARSYQILLWATRKKSSCSPLGYQTSYLYGGENPAISCSHLQQSLTGITQQCQSAKLAHLTDCCFGRFIKNFVQNVWQV